MESKRLIIAVALSLAVLLGYPKLLKMIYPEGPESAQAPGMVEEAQPQPTTALPAQTGVAPGAPPPPLAAPLASARESAPETLSTVETPLYKAVFTNRGGAIKSWELKEYTEAKSASSARINLGRNPAGATTNKTRLIIGGNAYDIVFSPAKPRVVLLEGDAGELLFTGSPIEGVVVEKKYLFTAAGYIFDTQLKIRNDTDTRLTGQIATVLSASFVDTSTGKVRYHSGPIIQTSEKLLRQDADEHQLSGRGHVSWLGLEDKYFLTAMIPPKESAMNWSTEIPSEGVYRSEVQAELDLGPGYTADYAYTIFAGPKVFDQLKAYRVGLEEAIEFGVFKFMAKPFLAILNQFQKYLKNYGLAIIIFTFIIKVIFYPLTKHSLTSMKEMQKVQPQLKAIKERFKGDKERLNKETMGLYKKYKINPLSGCLPMVMQIPVFIALYEVLYVAIELRHAPLFLWITDLSAKDPYYITPLLMGGSMFLQQKMSPSSPDPTQAKMMMLMPVVFTFMFLSFPSGLVLYWLVNNILSVAQQYKINKTSTGPPKLRAPKAGKAAKGAKA